MLRKPGSGAQSQVSRPLTPQEKRREPRHAVDGEVTLGLDQFSSHHEIAGRLVDVSITGFRARHSCGLLENGLIVTFKHDLASGTARVIWNRMAADGFETGFLIL